MSSRRRRPHKGGGKHAPSSHRRKKSLGSSSSRPFRANFSTSQPRPQGRQQRGGGQPPPSGNLFESYRQRSKHPSLVGSRPQLVSRSRTNSRSLHALSTSGSSGSSGSSSSFDVTLNKLTGSKRNRQRKGRGKLRRHRFDLNTTGSASGPSSFSFGLVSQQQHQPPPHKRQRRRGPESDVISQTNMKNRNKNSYGTLIRASRQKKNRRKELRAKLQLKVKKLDEDLSQILQSDPNAMMSVMRKKKKRKRRSDGDGDGRKAPEPDGAEGEGEREMSKVVQSGSGDVVEEEAQPQQQPRPQAELDFTDSPFSSAPAPVRPAAAAVPVAPNPPPSNPSPTDVSDPHDPFGLEELADQFRSQQQRRRKASSSSSSTSSGSGPASFVRPERPVDILRTIEQQRLFLQQLKDSRELRRRQQPQPASDSGPSYRPAALNRNTGDVLLGSPDALADDYDRFLKDEEEEFMVEDPSFLRYAGSNPNPNLNMLVETSQSVYDTRKKTRVRGKERRRAARMPQMPVLMPEHVNLESTLVGLETPDADAFDLPESFVGLRESFDALEPEILHRRLLRLETLHCSQLGGDQKQKMKAFFILLLKYLFLLLKKRASDASLDSRIDVIARHIHFVLFQVPKHGGIVMRDRLDQMMSQGSRRMPSIPHVMLAALMVRMYPMTDRMHPISSPLLIYLQRSLSCCSISSHEDLARGVFLAHLTLSFCQESVKVIPEMILFLASLLRTRLDPDVSLPGAFLPRLFSSRKDWLRGTLVPEGTAAQVSWYTLLFEASSIPEDVFRTNILRLSFQICEGVFRSVSRLPSFRSLVAPLTSVLVAIPLPEGSSMVAIRDRISTSVETWEQVRTQRRPLRWLQFKEEVGQVRPLAPAFEEDFRGKIVNMPKATFLRKKLSKRIRRTRKKTAKELHKRSVFETAVRLRSDQRRKFEEKQKYRRAIGILRRDYQKAHTNLVRNRQADRLRERKQRVRELKSRRADTTT